MGTIDVPEFAEGYRRAGSARPWLVFGASGYVGGYLVRYLAAAGIPVVDVPLVSVGGGLGSLAMVEFLRVAGLPTSAMAAMADAVIVAAGFDSGTESEGSDRTFRLPPGQDELIETLAATGKPVAVVLTAGGAVDMRNWLDDVAAVLTAWYPGQEGGTAVAEVLFGDVNPSGSLPATFERDWRESPAYGDYYPEPGTNRSPGGNWSTILMSLATPVDDAFSNSNS